MMKPARLNQFITRLARLARAVSKTISQLPDENYAEQVRAAYNSPLNRRVNSRLRRLRNEVHGGC